MATTVEQLKEQGLLEPGEQSFANQTVAPPEDLTVPPSFKAEVPPVIDATGAADAISEPTEISPALQQLMDERDRLAKTGSALPLPPEEAPVPEPREPVEATGTAAQINELFPEQEGLGDKYLALRKEAGADKLDATLQTAQDSLDELNAQIEGIAEDVRAQIGQDAPASFIAATIADRTRRLAPELRRRQRAVNSAQRRLTAINQRVSQQLGFAEKDLDAEVRRRSEMKRDLMNQLELFGPEAFDNLNDNQLAAVEKILGFQEGSLKTGLQALKDQPEDVDTFTDVVGGRLKLFNKDTGEEIKDLGVATGRVSLSGGGGADTTRFSRDETNTIKAIGLENANTEVQNIAVNALTPTERSEFNAALKNAQKTQSVEPSLFFEKWVAQKVEEEFAENSIGGSSIQNLINQKLGEQE